MQCFFFQSIMSIQDFVDVMTTVNFEDVVKRSSNILVLARMYSWGAH